MFVVNADRWHDLRQRGRLTTGPSANAPLSQVRDLLGHASIVTTERYDNQKPEALMAAAKLLETGETFQNLSSSDADADTKRGDQQDETLTR